MWTKMILSGITYIQWIKCMFIDVIYTDYRIIIGGDIWNKPNVIEFKFPM